MAYSHNLQPNVAPNGIRYGIISANSLDQDLVHDLLYHIGEDLTYAEAELEASNIAECEAENIEEEVRIAIAEAGGFTDREYEDVIEEWVEKAYKDLGYDGREDYIQRRIEEQMDNYYCEEPVTAFTYEGVKGQTTWLGGALLLWIFDSPYTGTFQLCSPCVPNACNLDQPENGGYAGYTVPTHWLA